LFTVGKSKIDAQLGEGTFVPSAGALIGHDVKLNLSDTGFNTTRKYSEIVGVSKRSTLGLQYQQKNSPSFLDAMYSKFKVRDEATNYSYIKHPLILRGIQRDGEPGYEPQRWGLGIENATGLNDGLIRGGAATALERSTIDAARIAKFLASPKGLLWTTKQAGLHLTNPKVQTLTPGVLQTRTFNITSPLQNVANTAFGLHFTRHGIPFANEIASYENVINGIEFIGDFLPTSNRLVGLKNELGIVDPILSTDSFTGKVLNVLSRTKKALGFKGSLIPSLSGLGGPGSVYGLGATSINRWTNTRDKSSEIALEGSRFWVTSTIKNQYAKFKSGNAFKSTAPDASGQENIEDFDNAGLKDLIIDPDKQVEYPGFYRNVSDLYPHNETNITRTGDQNATPNNKDDSGVVETGIKAYSTLAYGKLPDRQKDGRTSILNFKQLGDTPKKNGDSVDADNDDYTTNNLNTRFGMGNQGEVGVDRSDYTKSPEVFRGDKVNAIDFSPDGIPYKDIYSALGQSEDPYRDGDFVRFYFTGPQQIGRSSEGGDSQDSQKEEVLVFRAALGSFSDQFSPSWNPTQILGRADAVHVYNQWSRQVTFDFKVHATSRDEMRPLWRKLNYLASWTAPRYTSGLMRGPYIRFTLGNLFQETPCFINSLTFTTDNDIPWEINLEKDDNMMQLPHGVNVSMGLTMLMDFRPEWDGRMYSLSERGRATSKSDPKNWLNDSTVATKD
jgi:hypothetical protein